jgi:dienelactone hydrolase
VKLVNAMLAGLLAATLVGCHGSAGPTGVLEVTPIQSLVDEPVHVRVTGLNPGQRIALSASMPELEGARWASRATFTAGADGVVDLDRDAPDAGDYSGVDGMGLIASMAVQGPATTTGASAETDGGFVLRISLSGGASIDLRRVVLASAVTTHELTIAADRVSGLLALPAHPTGPGVLLIGGSEGGLSKSMTWVAEVLAAHGYPALAIAYFHAPGLPGELQNIPIEYFATAARLLPGPVRVVGYSRGSEAAMLLSGLYPDLVAGAVLVSPAASVHVGFPNGGNAWTYHGAAQTQIPFDAIAGPVLAFVGTDDQIWPSGSYVQTLQYRLGQRLDTLEVDGAGHEMLGVPYLSFDPAVTQPLTGEQLDLGGTRLGDEQARRQTWAALLHFLATPPAH